MRRLGSRLAAGGRGGSRSARRPHARPSDQNPPKWHSHFVDSTTGHVPLQWRDRRSRIGDVLFGWSGPRRSERARAAFGAVPAQQVAPFAARGCETSDLSHWRPPHGSCASCEASGYRQSSGPRPVRAASCACNLAAVCYSPWRGKRIERRCFSRGRPASWNADAPMGPSENDCATFPSFIPGDARARAERREAGGSCRDSISLDR